MRVKQAKQDKIVYGTKASELERESMKIRNDLQTIIKQVC